MSQIKPLPDEYGVGFTSMSQLPEYSSKYREELTGRYWNYHFTKDCCEWPVKKELDKQYVIDGFSPNLNKALHVGHLRNLAIANSLSKLLRPNVKCVALFGASLGVYSWAEKEIQGWFDFLKYRPTIYYDVLMPLDLVPRFLQTEGESAGCEVWADNPKVIVTTSAGKHTYSFADIAFSKLAQPTHYLTGAEQKEHFESLGLGDKHLPMGLVMGSDGKKMKSRKTTKNGKEVAEAYGANDAMYDLKANLKETPDREELAWNVLAWNFLQTSRSQNVKFEADKWTLPDSPGMYITYTYARIRSALMEAGFLSVETLNDMPPTVPTQSDIELMGYAEYFHHWEIRAIEQMDPAPIAHFAHDLARKLGVAYHGERIKDGRYEFKYAVYKAWQTLGKCMDLLGMFRLDKV